MNTTPNDIPNKVIDLTRQLLAELDETHAKRDISLNDSLQDHLGIDSISRAELFSRIEKAFAIELPLTEFNEAETLADIYTIIVSVRASKEPQSQLVRQTMPEITNTDPSQANTLLDVLALHAQATPDRVHMYFQDDNGKEEVITYQHLYSKARQVAYQLKKHGLKPHETVAIMLPTQPGFFYSFMGVLFAGGVPVPIYPPARAHQLEDYARKESKILTNAGARFLITFKEAKTLGRLLKPFVHTLKEVLIVDELLLSEETAPPVKVNTNDLALIQYTSGSTSLPKGVSLTHHNLLANIRSYGTALQLTSSDVCVSWLPLYHDLGLIGNWLGSLYWGPVLVAFSPLVFLSRPEKWLWAIHYHRATISAGPNFAYELCVRKVDPAMIEGLDLSSWRAAINGAETIYPKTLERFSTKFRPYGFKLEAFLPVYGLAENSLGVTCPPLGRKPIYDRIDRTQFEKEHRAIPTDSTDTKHSLQFTSCGPPLPDNEIRIVNDENQEIAERCVGRIQFKSAASMQGYFNNPEATSAVHHQGWWDTGDLGYLAKGEIYITGRRKDVIIKSGRNLFASEIEDLASEVPEIRRGCVIAFSLNDAEKGTDQLIIVAELVGNKKNQQEIKNQISDKITTSLNVAPDKVILVAPRIIPKTSSGKLQRAACKTMYLENKLDKKILPPWIQLLKISAKSFLTSLINFTAKIGKIIYSIYMALIILITLLPMWVIVKFTPYRFSSWIFRKWMWLLCLLSLCPKKFTGLENLTKAKPMIYVSNHASYLDIALLSSFLPCGTKFVGKKSLFKVPILKTFLIKLQHISIDKNDISKSIQDSRQIEYVLERGQSVLIFPEGTFSYAPGLRPFKLGAFKIAAEMKLPICPIALTGTRYVLRGNELIMKPHRATITIMPPVHPTGTELTEIVNLKNKVRGQILASSSTPGIVPPVVINGQLHVDGGLLNNLPVDVMKNILGPGSKIIAAKLSRQEVDKVKYKFPPELSLKQTLLIKMRITHKLYRFPPFFDMFLNSLLVGSAYKELQNSLLADILINPHVSKYRSLSVQRKNEEQLIEAGYEQALIAIKETLLR